MHISYFFFFYSKSSNFLGLPRIPTTISVSERRKGRTLRIRWTTPESPTVTGPILYVLEERHHAGSEFTEASLGPWTPRHRTNKTNIKLRNLVKPGRWYQFRIAAINTLGSRGYSDSSKEFITSLGKKQTSNVYLQICNLDLFIRS